MNKNSFLLTKWYLDCVAENGDAAILYVADLKWKGLSFHYGSILTVLEGKVGCASSLHGSAVPEANAAIIRLSHPDLNVEGTWEGLRPPIRRIVFENAGGSVDWHCLQPMSQASLCLPRRIKITGRGYAECLTVSLPPWQLPLTTLIWGRYLSGQDAIVWLDWKGQGHQKQVLIHNGQEHHATSMTESEVAFADAGARLELDRGLILRQGRLKDTVFKGISRLAGLLPRSIFSVNECKWRSRGVFRTSCGESSGWVIHEAVKWRD